MPERARKKEQVVTPKTQASCDSLAGTSCQGAWVCILLKTRHMIVVLSLAILGLITILLIAHSLENAPEAFEDENGFHIRASDAAATPVVASISSAGELVS